MIEKITGFIAAGIHKVLTWFADLWQVFKDFVVDVPYEILDNILTWFQELINSIPVPSVFNQGDVWSGIGGNALWFCSALRIPTVIAIIVAAWGIRFIINLIPAALTRV